MQGVISPSLPYSILRNPAPDWVFLCLGLVEQWCDSAAWCDFWCDLRATGGGVHDLPLNAGTSRFVLTMVGLGRP